MTNDGWMSGFDLLPVEPGTPLKFPVFCGHHGRDVPGKAYPAPVWSSVPSEVRALAARVTRGGECWACDECAKALGLTP